MQIPGLFELIMALALKHFYDVIVLEAETSVKDHSVISMTVFVSGALAVNLITAILHSCVFRRVYLSILAICV